MDSDNARLLRDALEAIPIAADEVNGAIDAQTYDEKRKLRDWPNDHQFEVYLTAKQEIDLNAAIIVAQRILASTGSDAQTTDPADELEATMKNDRVSNVRYYYSMETFAVTLRDGRQGQGSTIRAAIESATEKEA